MMNRGLRVSKRGGAAAAVTLAVAAALTGTAISSAGKPTVASQTKTPPQLTFTLVSGKCPDGRKPVSGGFRVANTNSFFLNNSEAIDGRKWSVNTLSVEGGVAFTSFAYCSRLGKSVVRRRKEESLDPDSRETTTATCRHNERVLSGGYSFIFQDANFPIARESFRQGSRSWTVNGQASGDPEDPDTTLVVFAYCVPKGKAPSISTEKSSKQLQAGDDNPSQAQCPRSRYALSGGYRWTGDEVDVVQVSMRDGDRTWKQRVEVNSPGKFTTLAYCGKE